MMKKKKQAVLVRASRYETLAYERLIVSLIVPLSVVHVGCYLR